MNAQNSFESVADQRIGENHPAALAKREQAISAAAWNCDEMIAARTKNDGRISSIGAILYSRDGGTWVQIDDAPQMFFVPSFSAGDIQSAFGFASRFWLVTVDPDDGAMG